MESLPIEVYQLIVTALSNPRDLGRLRQVNTVWRACVNTFTENIDLNNFTTIVPWVYLRDFQRV